MQFELQVEKPAKWTRLDESRHGLGGPRNHLGNAAMNYEGAIWFFFRPAEMAEACRSTFGRCLNLKLPSTALMKFEAASDGLTYFALDRGKYETARYRRDGSGFVSSIRLTRPLGVRTIISGP